MSGGSEALIYVLVFGAALALVEGIYLALFGPSIRLSNKVNRRLDLMEKGTAREEVLRQLRKEMSRHARARTIPLFGMLAERAQKAGIAFSPQQLVGLMAAIAGLSFVIFGLTTSTPAQVRAVISVVIGVGGVILWVNQKAAKRMAMIEEQLPEAVDLMVRALKVGQPLSAAIGTVAREIPDPLGSEFGVIADEAAYGRSIAEGFRNLAERLDLQDLRFLSVAVMIQQQSGGNLAEILRNLGEVMRARFRLFRRVKAITAEARWSGIFLSSFPLLTLAGVMIMMPDYYDEVMDKPIFIPACCAVGGLLATNVLFMKIMVNIKV